MVVFIGVGEFGKVIVGGILIKVVEGVEYVKSIGNDVVLKVYESV